MENVKNEKAKKNGILKWVAIAACLVIVVGVIILVPNLIGDKTAPESAGENGEDFEYNANDALADSVDTTESADKAETQDHLAAEKCEPIITGFEKVDVELAEDLALSKGARAFMILSKHKFILHEGHEMNWYEFYNGCIDGTVGNDKDAILSYAMDSLEQFEKLSLTEEAAQAKAIIDAMGGNAN
ncbi:MAG: hypothetical protein E7660_00775 [Ruminococcaceae bacterium]|nr:hypothetical protein [Oscillospiraceae bacterium]